MYGSRGHRSSTTPMDFEYTNRVGPVDPSSPFMNIGGQSAKKRELPRHNSFRFGKGEKAQKLTSGPSFGQPGPHSVLDSPSKNAFATPNRPHLREPDNRPFYFSQESAKPLPSIPAHVQNAWEPRTPASNYDFSSGGETPTTPQVDSDAATPDTQLADKMGRLTNGDNGSPKKGASRPSWFKRMISSPSPTKESKEREKEDTRKYYSSKAEHRIQKRRSERSRSTKKKATVQDVDGDDSDNDTATGSHLGSQAGAQAQKTYMTSIAGFLHWIEAHPHLPSVLSYYMQLTVNIFLGFGFLYIVYAAWRGVMADVEIEATKHQNEVIIEIASCQRKYTENRCQPENMAPALEAMCGFWESCMKRNPRQVAFGKVTAKTFAAIFNDFVEGISYKSMIFTAIIIFGGFNLSNWAFGLIRSQQQQRHPNQYPNDFIPQTPHRVPSNNYIDYNQQQNYGQNWEQNTPYQTPYGSMRHIEAPPLMHTQSMPALPSTAQEGAGLVEERKSTRKRGIFR